METLIQKAPIEFTEKSINHIRKLRKWTMFFSILGFIFMGICIVLIPFLLFVASFNIPFGNAYLTLLPLFLIMALYFYPVYCLYLFSSNSKKAISNSDSNSFEIAFKYLKLHYRFMGILVIIMLSLYFIAGVIMLSFGIGRWH